MIVVILRLNIKHLQKERLHLFNILHMDLLLELCIRDGFFFLENLLKLLLNFAAYILCLSSPTLSQMM